MNFHNFLKLKIRENVIFLFVLHSKLNEIMENATKFFVSKYDWKIIIKFYPIIKNDNF